MYLKKVLHEHLSLIVGNSFSFGCVSLPEQSFVAFIYIKSWIYAQSVLKTVIYSSNLFIYNAKYF